MSPSTSSRDGVQPGPGLLARWLAWWRGAGSSPTPPSSSARRSVGGARPSVRRAQRTSARPDRGASLPAWNERSASASRDPLIAQRDLLVQLHARSRTVLDGERAFFERLMRVVREGDPSLPLFPDAALRLDRALRGGEPSLADVAVLIGGDPELVRRTIQAASAAVHGRGVPDLERALARIGIEGAWRVAMSAVLGSPVFRVASHRDEVETARSLSLVAGEIAADVCPDPQERGRAFLAAVLHEIGTLQILRYASGPGGDADANARRDAIARFGAAIGQRIATEWKLPEPELAADVGALPQVRGAGGRLAVRCAKAGIIAAHAALAVDDDTQEPDPRWASAIEALDLAEDPFALRDAARALRAKHAAS